MAKLRRLVIEAEKQQMEAEVAHCAAAQSCSASTELSLSLSLSTRHANIRAATLVIRTITPQWQKQDFASEPTDLAELLLGPTFPLRKVGQGVFCPSF